MRRLTTALMLFAMYGTAFADGLAGLREICAPGDTAVLGAVKVSGIVVSDCGSPNMELNPNLKFDIVDVSLNERTAYIQEADGNCGVRIVFNEAEANTLKRYDKVVLNLEGGVLCHESNPDRITVRGLAASAVQERSAGTVADVAVKQKFISELTDSDIYTQVVLKDLEMVFKDGSYADIYEPYGQYCEPLHEGLYTINKRMDGWASLLRDGRGSTIYLLVNTKCPWRRTGKPLVAGTGPVTGIIVHTPMRRYGGDMGRFCIRPVDASDIGFSRKNKSSWKQLSGWCLDGTASNSNLRCLAYRAGSGKTAARGINLSQTADVPVRFSGRTAILSSTSTVISMLSTLPERGIPTTEPFSSRGLPPGGSRLMLQAILQVSSLSILMSMPAKCPEMKWLSIFPGMQAHRMPTKAGVSPLSGLSSIASTGEAGSLLLKRQPGLP